MNQQDLHSVSGLVVAKISIETLMANISPFFKKKIEVFLEVKTSIWILAHLEKGKMLFKRRSFFNWMFVLLKHFRPFCKIIEPKF